MQTKFTADVNKTVTVEGVLYTITAPAIPPGMHLYANEVEVQSGEQITLSSDMSLTFSVDPVEPPKITVTHKNTDSAKYDGYPISNGQEITIAGGNHTLDFVGATAIPDVTITGSGVTGFSVNSISYNDSALPFTFRPMGGITNSVFVQGEATEAKHITIVGTDIETMTVNNVEQPLPFTTLVTEDLKIGVAGKIYQVDVSSVGGAKIERGNQLISDGTAPTHQIIDITEDTYLSIDGTHTMQFDGTDIKNISVNGVNVPFTNLPAKVKNVKMQADVNITGFAPSEVHISGMYQESVVIDGINIPLNPENNSFDVELETVEQNHFINLIGKQPRAYGLTWKDNGTTNILMDGKKMKDGTTSLITKDVMIDTRALPIPVHFESKDTVTIDVDGRKFMTNDFTVEIDAKTEVDVNTYTCELTVDFGDNSYRITLPQKIVTITATHRDGWIFDGWSSNNLGINNPKSVMTTVDLSGKSTGHLVCHYQQYPTINKPNHWN